MDPFRDDQTAMQARAEELEIELEEARSALANALAPREAMAKALKEDEETRAREEGEIETLERTLSDLRAELERTRHELVALQQRTVP